MHGVSDHDACIGVDHMAMSSAHVLLYHVLMYSSHHISPTGLEPFENAHFLSDLIFAVPESDAHALDTYILSMPTMRILQRKCQLVTEHGARAARAILACLLKHSGKLDATLDVAETLTLSTAANISDIKIPNSVLKLWKMGYEATSEFISAHQSNLVNFCVKTGCDQTVVAHPEQPNR